jgi:hypothetical protein
MYDSSADRRQDSSDTIIDYATLPLQIFHPAD